MGNTSSDTEFNGASGLDVDVLVVGSGFGGSVTALRLAEKGYRVTVVEAGRRYSAPPEASGTAKKEHVRAALGEASPEASGTQKEARSRRGAVAPLPRTSMDIRRYLWMPWLGCHGIQKITLLGRVLVLSGAAVGGGSMVYANTLYRPLEPFYADPQWAGLADWRAELAPYYDQAERMLGVVHNPTTTYADKVFRTVAEEMGVGDTFQLADVGVYFGPEGRPAPGEPAEDPYFGGAGPRRVGCVQCGECMSGCRHEAKNTLDRNYLYLAERLGVTVVADTTIRSVTPLPGGGYEVVGEPTGAWPAVTPWGRVRARGRQRRWRAGQVVFAAGALGTQQLLHAMRAGGQLPGLSERLGHLTRTNSEAILGAVRTRPDERITRGVAITSSFYPDPHTHVEPVRYGRGSNLLAPLASTMTDGGGRVPRWARFLGACLRRPHLAVAACLPWRWSERAMIVLVMQSQDNSLVVRRRRGPFGTSWLTSRQGHGEPNPTWIPAGNDATRRIAAEIGGHPAGSITEVANIPLTAHILGGAPIGENPERGVVDAYQRVFGHPGLHVADGAAVCANLGVNPSLTITAQAERAMSFWPNKGDSDPRPPLGAPYRRIDPVAPRHPAVPAFAPAAYRIGGLPVVAVTHVPDAEGR
ncbi:FAD-dependent oxidoreductase [Pseudofrankia asymbiotica]|uniref:Cholesterol oxidase n=1 Tax=Pseudofrankia asymbiotica TaxID=1834516 RepID=A0A1V2IBY4_9ACTN|nr:GMC family oxidoreductase [Pseudofrankia asymbiotica]ONH30595.1 cholesterol oxidase [Pseudofrankia asymbiotica]